MNAFVHFNAARAAFIVQFGQHEIQHIYINTPPPPLAPKFRWLIRGRFRRGHDDSINSLELLPGNAFK